MTDTAGGYMGVGKEFERHEMVDYGTDEYVRGDAHSNTVESYFATLKRGINGVPPRFRSPFEAVPRGI